MTIFKTIRSWFVKEKSKRFWNDCPLCGAALELSMASFNNTLVCSKVPYHYLSNKHNDWFCIKPYYITRFNLGTTEIFRMDKGTDLINYFPFILPFCQFSSVKKIERLTKQFAILL